MKRFNLFARVVVFCLGTALVSVLGGNGTAQTTPTQRPAPAPTVSPSPQKPNEEDEVIKVETELVNLNVRVVDRNSRPVGGLRQSEFKIFEDGVPQRIEFFSQSEVPMKYSLVIDNSGSMRSQIDKVIEASKVLVNTNKPQDETSLIRFVSSDKIEIIQDFTSNKTDLNDALDNLYIEGGQTAIIDAVYLAASRISEADKSVKDPDRTRRALILISDGEDRDSYYKEAQLFELLRETDVQIYVVGFVSELSKEAGFISKSPQGKAKAFLERLAAETGGKVYFPSNISELNAIARDISSELRTQYSIGYIPTNDRKDGTFRNIKVMVDDGPKKEKRIPITRAGRTAESESTAPGLKAARPGMKQP